MVAVVGALLVACGQSPGGEPNGSFAPPSAIGRPAATATPNPISIVSSRYGALEIKTRPLESCELTVKVSAGTFGEGPPRTLTGKADAAGALVWSYPTPLVPAGVGRHEIRCAGDQGPSDIWSDFAVALKALDAKGFTTRIRSVDPVQGLEGVTTRLEPSLVPARDAAIAKITATLAKEWGIATRGLGALTLVPESADLDIYVLPGRGTSLHNLAADGTQRVLIYVVSDLGPVSPENAVAVALHELGHIWCCFGIDAGTDGHWLEKVPDPLLQGVDQYGLMTHPVTCLVKPGLESCPNRFSERELKEMGFTQIPAPPPDACVTQSTALQSQLKALDASLASERAIIDSQQNDLASLSAQIADIERQYPSRSLPPDVYARYIALIDQYNRTLGDNHARIEAFNRDVDQRNGLAQRLNALPC
jgi:hypothetical protein